MGRVTAGTSSVGSRLKRESERFLRGQRENGETSASRHAEKQTGGEHFETRQTVALIGDVSCGIMVL